MGVLMIMLLACGAGAPEPSGAAGTDGSPSATTPAPTSSGSTDLPPSDPLADVTAVSAAAHAKGGFDVAVTIESPDIGCDRYADWWEVIGTDGSLIYRRILNHSHVDEQPFTRSGGPVAIGEAEEVLVRAHLHPDGYGGAVLRGSVSGGFELDSAITGDFAAELAEEAPLPEKCLY